MESGGQGDSSLKEGIERRPEAQALGPYAEFFLEPDELPRLRDYSAKGLIHWISNKDDHNADGSPSELNFKRINEWYYSKNSGWNNGVKGPWDTITNFPTFLCVSFLLFIIIVPSLMIMDFGMIEQFKEFILAWAFFFVISIFLPYPQQDDKKNFSNWSKKHNHQLCQTSLRAQDDIEIRGAWRKGYSNLSTYYITEPSDYPLFPDSDMKIHDRMSREERYQLALLRKNGLWADSSKTASYAKWLGWSEEDIEIRRKEDEECHLARYIESRTRMDLRNGLDRVMSSDHREKYLPILVDEPEFWLKREVTVNEPGSEDARKESFLQWVDHVMSSPGAHYLVSEAAKGKSTTLNLLTLHHVNSESGIWPLRVKLRELYSLTSEQPLISRVREFYEISADEEFEYVKERFDAVMKLDADSGKPLLILDGLDELADSDQRKLYSDLRSEKWDIPILVVTRPQENIIRKETHAKLGKMTGPQRFKVLRNLDLDPKVLRQLNNLPEVLIDRPFALLIAAEKIREKQSDSLDDENFNLSMSEICRTYDEKYFEREKDKRLNMDLKPHSVVQPIIEALGYLAIHQIRHRAPPKETDEEVKNRANEFDIATELKLIDSNRNMIDSWLVGYYAAKGVGFDRGVWAEVLDDLNQYRDRSELIIRHFLASAPVEHTPKWNEFAEKAPVVMDIASQEWLAMDTSTRKEMMGRLGIPCDDDGRLNFTPDHDFRECELPELLALLHFHCSISDSDKWHDPKPFEDIQWTQMFTVVVERYRAETLVMRQKQIRETFTSPNHDKKFTIMALEFFSGLSNWFHFREAHSVLEMVHDEVKAAFLSGMTLKLIPFNHEKSRKSRKSLYYGKANPQPLLDYFKQSLTLSKEKRNSFVFTFSMIEIHANRKLFNLSSSNLEKLVPLEIDIFDEEFKHDLCILQRLIGVRHSSQIWERENVLSDDEMQSLEIIKPGNTYKFQIGSIPADDYITLQTFSLDDRLSERSIKSTNYIVGAHNPSVLSFIDCKNLTRIRTSKSSKLKESFFSTYIQPHRNQTLSPLLFTSENHDGEMEQLGKLTPTMSDLNDRLTVLFGSINIKKPEKIKLYLPSQYARIDMKSIYPYMRNATFWVNDVPVSRLKLKNEDAPRNAVYLLKFGRSDNSDSINVRTAIQIPYLEEMRPSYKLLIPPKYGGSEVPQENKKLAEAHQGFKEIQDARFQPDTEFDDIRDKLKEIGEVVVYLKASEPRMRHYKPFRVMLVPGLEWWEEGHSDITYEIGSPEHLNPIEKSFIDIFSGIREVPEDVHLNRWYTVKFCLDIDRWGYRDFFPTPGSIILNCQHCAVVPIEVLEDPEQVFVCEECSPLIQKESSEN